MAATLERTIERPAIDPSKPLKINNERFLSRYIASGNATESYISIYDCQRQSAEASAYKLLSNAQVKARLAYLLESAPKTSAEGAIIKLGQRMEAQKAVVIPAGGTLQFVDDNQAQINAATTLLKLHGKLKEGGVTINNQSNTFVAVTAAQVSDRLGSLVGVLSSLRNDKLIDITPQTS